MNQDDVLRLAREAGFMTGTFDMYCGLEPRRFAQSVGTDCLPELQRFAELVAADRDQLLVACRRAVLALAHAAEKDANYRADYDALSAAIAEIKEAAT